MIRGLVIFPVILLPCCQSGWHICSCSFWWPWPWCKVIVGWQRQKFSVELFWQLSKQQELTCFNGRQHFTWPWLCKHIWLDHLVFSCFLFPWTWYNGIEEPPAYSRIRPSYQSSCLSERWKRRGKSYNGIASHGMIKMLLSWIELNWIEHTHTPNSCYMKTETQQKHASKIMISFLGVLRFQGKSTPPSQ